MKGKNHGKVGINGWVSFSANFNEAKNATQEFGNLYVVLLKLYGENKDRIHYYVKLYFLSKCILKSMSI
jgi:hypothetical protein